jgi:anti-sigma factor RsiW
VEAYVDGELPTATRVRVRLHLLLCAGCRHHADVVRAIKHALAYVPYPRPGQSA